MPLSTGALLKEIREWARANQVTRLEFVDHRPDIGVVVRFQVDARGEYESAPTRSTEEFTDACAEYELEDGYLHRQLFAVPEKP